jgi:CxxC-x17-CxxC domain-containing protein
MAVWESTITRSKAIPPHSFGDRTLTNTEKQRRSPMAFQDKTLTCAECGNSFVFTAGEQEFYQQKGYTNEPRRCPTCRQARRSAESGGGFNRAPRQMYAAVCANCGQATQVPFQPRGDRPVYCSDCFSRMGGRSSSGGSSRR